MTSNEIMGALTLAQDLGDQWAEVDWDGMQDGEHVGIVLPKPTKAAIEILRDLHEMPLDEYPLAVREMCIALCLLARGEKLAELTAAEVPE